PLRGHGGGRRPADLVFVDHRLTRWGEGLALFVLVGTPIQRGLARTGLSGPIGPADVAQCFCSSSFATAALINSKTSGVTGNVCAVCGSAQASCCIFLSFSFTS